MVGLTEDTWNGYGVFALKTLWCALAADSSLRICPSFTPARLGRNSPRTSATTMKAPVKTSTMEEILFCHAVDTIEFG